MSTQRYITTPNVSVVIIWVAVYIFYEFCLAYNVVLILDWNGKTLLEPLYRAFDEVINSFQILGTQNKALCVTALQVETGISRSRALCLVLIFWGGWSKILQQYFWWKNLKPSTYKNSFLTLWNFNRFNRLKIGVVLSLLLVYVIALMNLFWMR